MNGRAHVTVLAVVMSVAFLGNGVAENSGVARSQLNEMTM